MVHPCKSGKIVIFCDEGRRKEAGMCAGWEQCKIGAKYSKIIKENN